MSFSPESDMWQIAAYYFTGYDAPKIDTLFKDWVGNDEIPLMKVEVTKQDHVTYVDTDDLNWLVENAGYRINNTDFVIPFYTTGNDNESGDDASGDTVSMYKARFTLLGDNKTDKGPVGGVTKGGKGESRYNNDFEKSDEGTTWDTTAQAQYSFGTGLAIEAVLNNPHGTQGFEWNGKDVPPDRAVDLGSFDRAAASFDRVAQFFVDRQAQLVDWQGRVGKEENDAWRGQAAGVFWDLVHQLNRQYESYAEQLRPKGVTGSKHGKAIRDARETFRRELQTLHGSWSTWQQSYSNPLTHLTTILGEIATQAWMSNITNINYKVNSGGYGNSFSTWTTYHAGGGFRQDARDIYGDTYGPLKELSTWKAVAEKAVERWKNQVKKDLVDKADTAFRNVHEAWSPAIFDLGTIRTKGGHSLDEQYQKDKATKDKADADAKYKHDKDKADKDKADADAKYAKDKADADAKYQRDKDEATAKEKAAKDEAEAKEKQAKAEQEQKEKEQEAKQKEQEAKQEAKEKEQEAKQEAKEKEQEAKQKELEAKQEAKQAEQEAKQEQKEKEQEQKQEEQEKKQEEAQKEQQALQIRQMNEQKAEQDRQKKEQEKKEKEQEAKQEQLQKEQEQKQEEQEQKQEAKEKEQEAKQEKLQKEQEAKQEEQEKKQEEIRKEQEQKQEEQEAKQEQLQKEQEQKQEEQQAKQEKLQSEQQNKQEQLQKEQQNRQDQLQGEQEKKQEEYQKQQQENQDKQFKLQQDQRDNLGDYLSHDGQLNGQTIDGPVNGDDSLTNPDGSVSHIDSHGRVVTEYPDGSTTTVDPQTHTSSIHDPSGHTSSGPLNAGDVVNNPDGSVSHMDSRGQVVTEYPDGSTTTVDPHSGATSVTHPDGSTTSGYLNGGSDQIPQAGGGSSNSAQYPSSYEEELWDKDPYESPGGGSGGDNQAAGSGNQSGSPMGGGGGTPLNPGSLPGRGGGGGGGGEGGNSERVRNVIDNGEVISNRRAGRQGGGVFGAGGPVSTSGGSPFAPGGGGAGGPGQTSTESGDRERETWVPEEEDVWGSDEGGSPAVIGR